MVNITRTRLVRAIAGVLLLAIGGLLLLQTLRIGGDLWKPYWALLFAAAGLAFLTLFATSRADVWASIPGLGLLGLAGSSGLHSLDSELALTWSGPLFLGGIALGFMAWYATRRADWWTIMPAGALLTMALVSGVSSAFGGIGTGGLFFLGLTSTLIAVYLLPVPSSEVGLARRRHWALVAAVPLFALGVVDLAASGSGFSYVWPILLILAGPWLALRTYWSRKRCRVTTGRR